jgi:hypothetical protein
MINNHLLLRNNYFLLKAPKEFHRVCFFLIKSSSKKYCTRAFYIMAVHYSLGIYALTYKYFTSEYIIIQAIGRRASSLRPLAEELLL